MKTRVLFFFLAALILFCCVPPLSAADTSVSFTIAPPPAGYPVFEKGHTDYRIGANFVTIDSDFMNITGAGVHGTYRRTYSSRFGTDASFGISALVGDAFDTTMMQMSITANGQFLLVNGPSLQFILLGGIGGDVAYMTMSIPTPMGSMENTTTTSIYSLSGGIQANIPFNNFIFSPYGLAKSSSGTASTETDYGTFSADIPTFNSIIIGVDLLYKPWNVSLSSIYQKMEEASMLSISVSKLIGKVF